MLATRLARVPPFERGITLGDFLVPIRLGERAASWQRHLLMVVIGALVIVLCARVSFYWPWNPLVPATLQTFGVLLIAALLGFRRALASVGLYIVLGAIGLPVFALGGSGVATIVSASPGALKLGVTGGYIVGFFVAAGLVGRLAELGWDRHIGGSLAAMAFGNVVIYLFGVPWLMAATGMDLSLALQRGLGDFIVGDVIKLVAAAGLLPIGWWLVRRRSSER